METNSKKQDNRTRDLTQGPILKLMLRFMFPLFFGIIFQQLYSTVDTMVVGRFLGVNALAGVGSTGALSFLIMGFCMGMSTGSAVPVAQRFGAKDYDEMRHYVGNIIWLKAGFSITITVIVSILCRQFLVWMGTPEDVLDYAYSYILIIFLGLPVTMTYNTLSAILRALGDSKRPVYFLVISSVLNVILDLLFIVVFHLGSAGAALATVLAQAVSAIVCFIYVVKKFSILKLSRDDLAPRWRYIKVLMWMGIPMGLQFSITAIGNTILQVSVNTLGASALAAISAASKVQMISFGPFDAIGTTMGTFGAQNLGAGKLERIDQGLKKSVLMVVVYSIAALGILYFVGQYLIMIFIDPSETAIIAQAKQFMLTSAVFYIPLAMICIFRTLIQSLGYSRVAMFAGVFEMVARIFIARVIIPQFGFTGVCFGNPAAWVMADVFLIPAYFTIRKKLDTQIPPIQKISEE